MLSQTEKAPGVYEIEYQLPGSIKPATKTLCDPVLYPRMPEMASAAANMELLQ